MNRISKENTILVAILTESGAPFNDEGVDYVKDMIVKKYPEMKDFPIIAMMGRTVYKPHQVSALLTANPEAFVVVSYNGGEKLSLYRPGDNPDLLQSLEFRAGAEQDKTAWEIFTTDDDEEEEDNA